MVFPFARERKQKLYSTLLNKHIEMNKWIDRDRSMNIYIYMYIHINRDKTMTMTPLLPGVPAPPPPKEAPKPMVLALDVRGHGDFGTWQEGTSEHDT